MCVMLQVFVSAVKHINLAASVLCIKACGVHFAPFSMRKGVEKVQMTLCINLPYDGSPCHIPHLYIYSGEYIREVHFE